MQDVLLILAAVTAVSAAGFVAIAALWLHRLRATAAAALAEAANRQVRSAQRLGEALEEVRKRQRHYEDQLHLLAQANTQLRQGLVTMASRLEHGEANTPRGDQTIH